MNLLKLMMVGFLFISLPVLSRAQKYWEISASPGLMNYYGDLTPPLFTVKEVNFGGQVSVRRYFDREHAVRVNVLHGKLAGDDHNFDRSYLRGNKFEGRLTEVAIMGELDVKGRKRFSTRFGYHRTSSLYLFAGGSVAYFDPKVTYGDPNSQDKKSDYKTWHLGMPIGGGVKIDLNEKIFFGLELSYRFTVSDFLDGTQASGNAFNNDSYTFGGISAGYRFVEKPKAAEKAPAEK
jgi:hypothetical protein